MELAGLGLYFVITVSLIIFLKLDGKLKINSGSF